MVIITNKPLLSIFTGNNMQESCYIPKKANAGIKGFYFDSVENNKVLTPFDYLLFCAVLTHLQTGKSVATISTLYRHITGKTQGRVKISKEMRNAIKQGLNRLKAVNIIRVLIENNGKNSEKANKPLIDFNETEKGGYLFRSFYPLLIIEDTATVRTVLPEMITPYKNKSIKMLCIEYAIISRCFYLQKRKKKKGLLFDINRLMTSNGILLTHKKRYLPFLTAICCHLKDIGFIKNFTISGSQMKME